MTFKPGDPKPPTSGRRRGRPRKAHTLRVYETLVEEGFSPVKYALSQLPDMKPAERVALCMELLSYIQNKARVAYELPVEPGATADPLEELSDDELEELVNLERSKG